MGLGLPPGTVMTKDEYDSLPIEMVERSSLLLPGDDHYSVEGTTEEVLRALDTTAAGQFVRFELSPPVNPLGDIYVRADQVVAVVPLPSLPRRVSSS